MNKVLSLSLFMMVLLLNLCCEDENKNIVNTQRIKGQKFFFQYDFVNEAWGHQHYGWVVDSTGNVCRYNLPQNLNDQDALGWTTAEAMNQILAEHGEDCYQIDRDELNNHIELIPEASNGEVVSLGHTACDAGTAAYFVLIYDPDKDRYQHVLLYQWGDFGFVNQSDAAHQLTQWMKSI